MELHENGPCFRSRDEAPVQFTRQSGEQIKEIKAEKILSLGIFPAHANTNISHSASVAAQPRSLHSPYRDILFGAVFSHSQPLRVLEEVLSCFNFALFSQLAQSASPFCVCSSPQRDPPPPFQPWLPLSLSSQRFFCACYLRWGAPMSQPSPLKGAAAALLPPPPMTMPSCHSSAP